MVPVSVANMSISKAGFVLLLKSEAEDDNRTLPIYIGPPEAQSILFRLNRVTLPRPMTHDLMRTLLKRLDARLEHVDIHDLKEGVFYARLHLLRQGRSLEIDARPSDAIALALRCDAPIFVAEKVMDEDGIVLPDEKETAAVEADAEAAATGAEESAEQEETARDPVARLERELLQAVKQERYEDAARLRDEIKRIGGKN